MKKLFTFIFVPLLFLSSIAKSTPALSSLPSAKATLFLDFDGQSVYASSWNGGKPLICAPSQMSDVQITEIFNRVSEDYRPFNINITTDSTVFLAAPLVQRIRIIVTSTSNWYPGVGGVSYTGSFRWGDDTPGFVFADKLGFSPKLVAECCSHESGHTLGLSHQSTYNGTCTLVATYNAGQGSGEIGWAPVMGNSYYKNLSGWNNGPTPSGCTADQDNLSIITSSYNGFTYRADDHSDNPNVNPTPLRVNNNAFSNAGIITTNTDKDVFKIDIAKNAALHLAVVPYSVGPNNDGADLDVMVTILDSSMQVISVYDQASVLSVVVDTSLSAGSYYVVVQGAGNVNASNYGSLGSYSISGTYTPLTITPIRQVLLTGKVDKNMHDLSWKVIADEPVKNLILESSADGTIFTTVSTFSSDSKEYKYSPNSKGHIFYRLKVNSITNQIVYSNIISLKSNGSEVEKFTITTQVHDDITINAKGDFEYKLADMSGRIITGGKGKAGVNIISINNHPNGIYFIQIISNNQRTTERIVRL